MAKTSTAATVNEAEAAHFGALAADWWDPKGRSAMLHRLNPVRLRYIRDGVDLHFGGDPTALRPLSGKRVLDVGCGAGLLAEPLARLGAQVTAIDAAAENIAVARDHAAAMGLEIDYRACGIEALDATGFDLITSLEVIEHVDNPPDFVKGLVDALADDGLLILSTPNRTQASRLFLVTLAEMSGQIPRGTHDWDKFLTPDELTAMLAEAGLEVTDTTGLSFNPASGFALSDNSALNYFVTAVKG